MSGLSDLLGPACAALLGWGAWRWCRRFAGLPNPVVVIALAGAVGSGVWMLVLALLGVGWPVWLLVLPSVVAAILGMVAAAPHIPRPRTPIRWVIPAIALAGGHALLLASRPVSGWDFRYIWGLKAKVFALAGTHDIAWLSWPSNGLQHPAYPPLWPDLIAMGIRLGGTAEGVAAVWDALLVLALAAACWDNLRDAAPPMRFAGSAVGAFAPAVLSTPCSGYADLIIAFLATVTLGSLARLRRDSIPVPAAEITLAAAVSGLALAKEEGMVLAFGAALTAMWFGRRRTGVLAAAAFIVPLTAWQLVVTLSGIHRDPRSFDPRTWETAGRQVIAWMGGHLPGATALLLLAWASVAAALLRSTASPVRVALVIWWGGVAAAYMTSLEPTAWHLATSLDRVIAAPLPAVVSVALAGNSPGDGSRPGPAR